MIALLTILLSSSVLAYGGGSGGTPPYEFTSEGRKVCKLTKVEAESNLSTKKLKRWTNLCPNNSKE